MPPPWRANSQLKSAVRALPTCSSPLGAGENRTRVTWRVITRPASDRASLGVVVGDGAARDRGPHDRELLRQLLEREAQQRGAHGVGDGAAHDVVVVGATHDARPPAPDVLGCRAGVAEQLDREVDVEDRRRPAERRGALHRQLGDHRHRVVAVLPRLEPEPVPRPAGERQREARRSGPAIPVSGPRGGRARTSPGRSATQARAGGMCTPGAKFCCWRGRSSSGTGTYGSVGTGGC